MSNTSSYYQHNRSEILKLIDITPRRVLDIGCGKGGVASMLHQNYPSLRITGFDKFKDDSFEYADIFESFHNFDLSSDWPVIDYTVFDFVLMLDVLEHLIDPQSVLAKLSKLLAKGTQVIISLPNFHAYSNLYEIVKTGRFQYKDSGILDRTHLRFYGQDDARDLIRPHFSIDAFMPHHLQPRSRLNKAASVVLGTKYSAYQNVFRCSALGA
jgi:trans-aconitate methyltransferase